MPQVAKNPDVHPRLLSVLRRAATQPVSLGLGAGSLVLAAGLSSWPIGLLGGLAYVALVAYDTFNPSFWQKAYASRQGTAPKLPSPEDIHDPGTRQAIAAIANAKAEIERAIAETPPAVMDTLSDTIASLRELDGQVARLVTRAEDIAGHLATLDVNALLAEVDQLGKRAVATTDAQARASFLDAKAEREDELRALAELRQAKDRVDATLLRLVALLSGLPTKIVHMRALDAQALDQISGGLNAELGAVADELKTSEKIMKSLGEVCQ